MTLAGRREAISIYSTGTATEPPRLAHSGPGHEEGEHGKHTLPAGSKAQPTSAGDGTLGSGRRAPAGPRKAG